jgi:transcriptional regulator with XRE-family HTH domain
MSFSINDLNNLVKSDDYKNYKEKNYRFLLLWEKIYARRKDLWLTQSDLRKLSKIPQNKISELEQWTYWEPKYDILNRLANALNIPIEYLQLDSITRKTVELYNYIFSKISWIPDIMQFMKLPYYVDLEMIKRNGKKITNFEYVRWHYWPFDKKVYDYQKLFSYDLEYWITDLKYIYLTDEEKSIIDIVLKNIPKDDWEKLKKLSYETDPMKKLWVSLGDNKFMGEKLF